MLKRLRCREATRLLSKQRDTRLSLWEKLSLRKHLVLSCSCSQCEKQFELMGRFQRHSGTVDRFTGSKPSQKNREINSYSIERSADVGPGPPINSTWHDALRSKEGLFGDGRVPVAGS